MPTNFTTVFKIVTIFGLDKFIIEILLQLLYCFQMSKEQEMRRSYYLYDRNRSGKISKEEMLDALIDLGKIPQAETDQNDKEKKPKIPDEVENLFSLMDFANDKRYLKR